MYVLINLNSIFALENNNLIELEKIFENEDKIDVIIWLKNNEFTSPEYQYDLNKKREEISKLQREVLSALGDNFEKRFVYKVTNGFAGSLSKKGFDILKDHHLIDRIYLDGEVGEALTESRPLIRADIVENEFWAF